MAISFASATGNLFNRIGKLGAVLANARSSQNTQNTALTSTSTGIVAQFNAEPDIQALTGQAYIGELNSIGSIGNLMRAVAEQTVNRIVYRDAPRIGQTLESLNTVDSIREIIRQMDVQGATVQSATVTGTAGTFTGTGNGIINISTRRPSDGLVQENIFAEDVLTTCIADSYIGGATAGRERFSIVGEGSQNNPFAFDWPLGSGASISFSAIDGSQDASAGNLLTNSNFEDFTSNSPDRWTLAVGTAGTHVNKETSLVFDGTGALRITGDGSNLTQIRQTFNSSSFTTGELDELTQYSFNVWVRRDGTAAAAGVMTIDLADGDGTVINDANSSANSFTIDLTALTTSYASYTGVFRTPEVLPATQRIRMRLTTALTNNRSVYFDRASLGVMKKLYTGGPSIAIHSGSTNFINGDYSTGTTFTNNRGGGTNLASFQVLWERLFGMSSLNLLLPTAASPSISDGLIA